MNNVKVFVIYLFVCLKFVVGNMNKYLQLCGVLGIYWLKIQICSTEIYICKM